MPEEPMEGQLARELISFEKAQWLNHASKNSEAAGVVGDCEMPPVPRASGDVPTPGLIGAAYEHFEPNQPSSSVTILILRKGRERARARANEEIWIFGALCLYWCDVELHI